MIGLGLNQQCVVLGQACLYGIGIGLGIARHDAIDERRAEKTCLSHPRLERGGIGSEVSAPQVNVLMHTLLQLAAVAADEFAGHDDEALGDVATARAKPVIEQLRELGGK